MKINFLLLFIIVATITGCSSSYKTGQTPDDVYFSPARIESHEVRREDENKTYDNPTGYSSVEDRDIRRRINNRRYRRYDDRYDSPYGYNYPYGYNNYPPVYLNPKTVRSTNQTRQTNLGAYKPNIGDSSTSFNPKLGGLNTGSTPSRTFGNPGTTTKPSGVGNFIRRVFANENGSYYQGSNSNYNNSYRNNNSNSNSSRSFEPRSSNNNSNSNNSSSETKTSSSGSGSAPVRTFKKD